MCTAGMEAADTAEWLGELGSDLQGPMASCCFFRKATTFWATAGDSTVNYPSREKGEAQLRAAPPSTRRWPEALLTHGGSGPTRRRVTVLEDALHIEPVGGTRLIVGAALQVCGQLAGPAVIDDPGVCGTDGICGGAGWGLTACGEAGALRGGPLVVSGWVSKEPRCMASLQHRPDALSENEPAPRGWRMPLGKTRWVEPG